MLLSMYIDLHILFGALNGLNITNVVQSSELNNLMTYFYPIQLVFYEPIYFNLIQFFLSCLFIRILV